MNFSFTSDRYWFSALLLWTLVLLSAASVEGATTKASPAVRAELFFELRASVRSLRLDADLRASARLEMAVHRRADGGAEMVLVRALEPAMKFYWIDPAGPFGEEAKAAAEVTLEEGSWQALARAEEDVGTRGRKMHADWRSESGGPRALDGTFAFVVIGPPVGRLSIAIDHSGRVESTENRLTDQWLRGPFDAFIGSWPGVAPPLGYWFWNEGELEPFDYEPHVYHALIEALSLLTHPMPPPASTAIWERFSDQVLHTLATLVPKIERSPRPEAQAVRVRRVATAEDPEARSDTGSSDTGSGVLGWGDSASALVVSRRQELSPPPSAAVALPDSAAGAVESDQLDLSWKGEGLDLYLSIGYRPLGSEQ